MSDTRHKGLIRGVMSGLRDAVVALIAFYGVCTIVFIAFHFVVGERWGLVGLFNNFMPLLLLPAVPLALLCLVLGRFPVSLTLAPALVMLVASYGALLAPNGVHAATEGQPLTLLTFNLHGNQQTNGVDPIVELVKQANADVVTLQELSPRVAKALEPLYPYQALHPDGDSPVLGQGVLSRYPIVEDEYWVKGLGNQRVVLELNSARVTLYNIHALNPFVSEEKGVRVDTARRTWAVDDVLQRTANEKSPLIIAGDFNMTDQTEIYRQVSGHYHDTFREAGSWLGFTFPANYRTIPPLARIDYVFHDDSVQSIAARVWPTAGGSDHRPVWVKLTLNTP